MMSQMRTKAARFVLNIFMAVIGLSFALWGLEGVFNASPTPFAAKVAGEMITEADFDTAMRRQTAELSRRFGQALTPEMIESFGIKRQVLDELVRQRVVDQEVKRLGLDVATTVLAKEITAIQAFKGVGGAFERTRYETLLAQNGWTEAEFVRVFKNDTLREIVTGAVSSGAATPVALADRLLAHNREKRTAKFFVLPPTAVGVIKPPSDETLKDFHRDNAGSFTAPERRNVIWFEVKANDLVKDITVSDEDLKSAYEERAQTYAVPEKRDLQQFLLQDKAKAEEAVAAIKAGKSFEQAGQEFAKLKPAELNLGEMTKSDLPPEAADAIFAAEAGSLIGPLDTPLGFVIARVQKVVPGKTAPFDEVKAKLKETMALERATDQLYSAVNKMQDEQSAGSSIETIAQNHGLTLHKAADIDRQGKGLDGKAVAGIPADPRFLTDLFGTDSGATTDLIEYPNQMFVMLKVDAVIPAALKPFDSVKADVLAGWMAAEQAARLGKLAKETVTGLQAGGDFDAAAKRFGSKIETTPALERNGGGQQVTKDLVAALFTLGAGGVTSAAAPDNKGYVIAKLADITPYDTSTDRTGVMKLGEELRRQIGEDYAEQMFAALKSRAKIEINPNAGSTAAP